MGSRLQVGLLVVLCLTLHCADIAAEENDLIERKDKGCINWSAGIFKSGGVGAPPAKSEKKSSEELQQALNHARTRALKNMLEIVLGTRVNSFGSVGSIASADDIIMAKVETLVKGAKAIKQEYLSDGTVEVTLQMNMHGGFAQFVLPEEIKQIEPIKTVSPENSPSTEEPQDTGSASAAEIFTGLVVDARGIQFSPAMAPVIIDEKDREVYGSAFASREFAVQQGMSGYSLDIQTANQNPRVAGNPLTVKGLRTADNLVSTIVISNADASKIKGASEHLSFLKKCRVMIVVD